MSWQNLPFCGEGIQPGCTSELLTVCRARHWILAIDRCDKLRERVLKVQGSSHLTSAERTKLGARIDDVRVVQTKIEQIKAQKKALDLTGPDRELVSRLIDVLALIEARFRASVLEMS